MDVRVKIDTAKLMQALAILPREIPPMLRKSHGIAMSRVQEKARTKGFHRYTSRSGELKKATGGAGPEIAPSGLFSALKLYENIPYSVRIHEGGGGRKDRLGRRMTNQPDQFMYKAFTAEKENIVSEIESAFSEAIRRAGL